METINNNIQQAISASPAKGKTTAGQKSKIRFSSVIRFFGYLIPVLSGIGQAGSRFDLYGFAVELIFFVAMTESIVFLHKKLDNISSKTLRGMASIILGFLLGSLIASLIIGLGFGLIYLSGI